MNRMKRMKHMKRTLVIALALAATSAGTAFAQQAVAPQGTVRAVQPTRSYRSYSVRPSNVRNVRPADKHGSDASWRHADAKAEGHYHTGR